MKYLILILILINFSFSQSMQSGNDFFALNNLHNYNIYVTYDIINDYQGPGTPIQCQVVFEKNDYQVRQDMISILDCQTLDNLLLKDHFAEIVGLVITTNKSYTLHQFIQELKKRLSND